MQERNNDTKQQYWQQEVLVKLYSRTRDAAAKRAILRRCRRRDAVANWPAKLTAETTSAKKDKFELLFH
jgi:hypothetical protein